MLVIMKRFNGKESLSSVNYRVQTIACKTWSPLCGKDLNHMLFKLSTYYLNICNRCVDSFTGKLITMLRLLKNTTFSTSVHRVTDIIKNVRTIFANFRHSRTAGCTVQGLTGMYTLVIPCIFLYEIH